MNILFFGIIAVVLGCLAFYLATIFPSSPKAEDVPVGRRIVSCSTAKNGDAHIARSDDYIQKIKEFKIQWEAETFTRHESEELLSIEGQLKALTVMEHLGKSFTYWDINMNLLGKDKSIEILSFTEFGVLHIKTINDFNKYFLPLDEPIYCPNCWGHGENKIQYISSPFSQAAKIHDRLQRVFKVIGKNLVLPVTSLVVFTNEQATMPQIIDNRVAHCSINNFYEFYTDFIHGRCHSYRPASKAALASAMTLFEQAGYVPMFYDQTLLTEEKENVRRIQLA